MQILHSISNEQLELVNSMAPYMEKTVLPILKETKTLWQPADFLPESSSETFLDEVNPDKEALASTITWHDTRIKLHSLNCENLGTYFGGKLEVQSGQQLVDKLSNLTSLTRIIEAIICLSSVPPQGFLSTGVSVLCRSENCGQGQICCQTTTSWYWLET